MATEKEITVTVSKDGSDVQIEPTKGFKDGTCLKETLALEGALGGKKNQIMKPEAAILPKVLKQKIGG